MFGQAIRSKCFVKSSTRYFSTNTLLYDVLNISPKFTQQELKMAYFTQSKKYHPDHMDGSSVKFLEISKAYEILQNANKKSAFDSMNESEYNGYVETWKKEYMVAKKESSIMSSAIISFFSKIIHGKPEKPKSRYNIDVNIENNGYKHLHFVLDTSTSMDSSRSGGENDLTICKKSILGLVDGIKSSNIESVSCQTFNQVTNVICDRLPPTSFEYYFQKIDLLKDTYPATALHDSIYRAITNILHLEKMSETLFVVLTDGGDNASKIKLNELINLITECNNVNIIIMAQDLDDVDNLQQIVASAHYGRLIRIGDSFSIKNIKDAYLDVQNTLLLGASSGRKSVIQL